MGDGVTTEPSASEGLTGISWLLGTESRLAPFTQRGHSLFGVRAEEAEHLQRERFAEDRHALAQVLVQDPPGPLHRCRAAFREALCDIERLFEQQLVGHATCDEPYPFRLAPVDEVRC